MTEINRTIQELVVDYACALRDGALPEFLKSLTRQEASEIVSSRQFADATEVVRVLNEVGFADKAVMPNVSLFISRVNAQITSRRKKAAWPPARGSATTRRSAGRAGRTEKRL